MDLIIENAREYFFPLPLIWISVKKETHVRINQFLWNILIRISPAQRKRVSELMNTSVGRSERLKVVEREASLAHGKFA